LRIRYWSHQFDRDDIDDVSARLAPALAERGHQVSVIAPELSRLVELVTPEGLSVHRLDPATAGNLLEVLSTLLSDAPDIELIEIGGPLSAFALAAAQASDRPIVATIHRPLADGTLEDGNPDGALLRASRAIAVDTETIAGQLRAFITGCKDRATVIPAGLPLTELTPGPRLVKRSTLLCVGPLVRDSGFDIAIDALAEVRERMRTADLIIAGDGPERAALEAQAAELGLGNAVNIRDAVAASRLPVLINQASMVIVPSRVPISACAVAILAGQLLRPVIASAIGAMPEIIEQQGSGLLVVPEEPAAIAGAVRRLLSEPGAAADLGRRGRTLARERFGWDRYVNDVEARLRATLARANASAPDAAVG
jgi:glycosyltransferase involved in cell wall biosynthesis